MPSKQTVCNRFPFKHNYDQQFFTKYSQNRLTQERKICLDKKMFPKYVLNSFCQKKCTLTLSTYNTYRTANLTFHPLLYLMISYTRHLFVKYSTRKNYLISNNQIAPSKMGYYLNNNVTKINVISLNPFKVNWYLCVIGKDKND